MSTPISAISTSAVRCLTPGSSSAASTGRRKGGSAPRSRPRAGRSLRQEVDVREDLPDDQRVLVLEATDQRFSQRGNLLAQLTAGEVGEHVGSVVPETSASSIVRPDVAEDVGGNAVELDPGVLQDLVQPGGLPLSDPGSASCDTGSGSAACGSAWAAQSWPQQPGLQQLTEPLRVLDIGLATGDLLHVPGVDEHQLEHGPRAPPIPASSTRRWPPSRPA